MLERYPELLGKAESSATSNRPWLEQADQYRNLLKRVRKSDEEVRSKWDQWAPLVNILAGGEVSRGMLPPGLLLNLHCRSHRRLY